MTQTPVRAADVARVLSSWRFVVSTESELQEGIATVLEAEWPGAFARERALPNDDLPEGKRLGRRDRPDFWCAESGIAVEVKLFRSRGGAAPKVFDQLARYGEHGAVREIVFATSSRRIASRIGDVAGGSGKPILRAVLSLGGF